MKWVGGGRGSENEEATSSDDNEVGVREFELGREGSPSDTRAASDDRPTDG